jgi:hypothetical protein
LVDQFLIKECIPMRNLVLAAVATAATVTAFAPASAQRWNDRGWRTVGFTTVNGRDSDTIRLPGITRQRAIRLCAINQPLRLRDFDIRFANGGRQDVNTRDILRAGTCTRAVDLRGNRRDIEAVRLRYDPILRSSMRPIVRVQTR